METTLGRAEQLSDTLGSNPDTVRWEKRPGKKERKRNDRASRSTRRKSGEGGKERMDNVYESPILDQGASTAV